MDLKLLKLNANHWISFFFVCGFMYFCSYGIIGSHISNLNSIFLTGILTKIFKINIFILLCTLIRLLLIKIYYIFNIRRLSVLFCVNLIKIFFFNFFKVSLLYSSYFLIYAFSWFGHSLNIEYNLGLDKLGLVFVLLTAFLVPSSLIVSWISLKYNTKYFFILFLTLEFLLINVFCAVDLMLFYIAFESILLPMYFLVGYWGSRERRMHAAYHSFYLH